MAAIEVIQSFTYLNGFTFKALFVTFVNVPMTVIKTLLAMLQ